MNEDYSLDILNDTADLYRYFDATRMSEYLYACVYKTIDQELKVELETLSATKRAAFFKDYGDTELATMVELIAPFFRLR